MVITQDSFFGCGVNWCSNCGRRLTNPLSVEKGIGPICRGKHSGGSDMSASEFYDNHLNIPLTQGIIMRRDENGVSTNVPHLVTHHSPNGFEFGYGGSGPADLALNAVEAILHHIGYKGKTTNCYDGACFRLAYNLHQDFKWEFIASVEHSGGTIPFDVALAWIRSFVPVEAVAG